MNTPNKPAAAKAALKENITCAVYGDRLCTSEERGIRPLLLWLRENPRALRGAAAADRIIGRAAAFILIYGGASYVYGEVMSRGAKKLLDEAGIKAEYSALCDCIVNRRGDGICPMEQLTADETDPEHAVKLLMQKVFQN